MSVRVKMEWNGKVASDAARAGAVAGLFEAAEHVLEESNRTVPRNEGILQASGETSLDAVKLQASVSYDKEYAVWLHEHPQFHFQAGRRGKWLELTIQERIQTVRDIIVKSIKGALK